MLKNGKVYCKGCIYNLNFSDYCRHPKNMRPAREPNWYDGRLEEYPEKKTMSINKLNDCKWHQEWKMCSITILDGIFNLLTKLTTKFKTKKD